MEVKIDTYGYVIPFTVYQRDGTTVRDLSGLSVQLSMKDQAGNTKTLAGTVTDADAGECEFTPTSSTFNTVATYDAEVKIYDGSTLVDKTKSFVINVIDDHE